MTKIHLITKINAPINQVFDLARNIDVHQQSTASSYEKSIDGITSGLINLNETVTWRGKHFGIYLKHKSLISEMEFPTYFVDEMLEGHFKSFRHEHNFVEKNEKTVMIDTIEYQTPFGMLGRIFDQLVLKNHLTQFITERNKFIKKLAESH
ncbi:MAG TPA: SRPBCC family protein [Flavobacterium sp.]|jgi:ligand-binding SRPBCC domain-containing protein|uniref:SRPBCC family protein n=1 Tax=Flavobacterium sp. TaxID=239 RepID=UPI002CCD9340|nr:SRPBCC family protein [Flavobacterium sp.]HPW98965.1 SRPBCC family protein [Flavobacterium sp.]HQA75191.1 SRPBCC family protein [Flavobacterium sp.]